MIKFIGKTFRSQLFNVVELQKKDGIMKWITLLIR